MPAIVLFKRRTIFGGDDLQPAALLTLSLRCLQILLFLGPIIAHIVKRSLQHGGLGKYIFYDYNNNDNSSTNDDTTNDTMIDSYCRSCSRSSQNMFALMLVSYTILSLLYDMASVALEARIAYTSSMGSPTQTEPRNSKMTQLLEYKLLPFTASLCAIWLAGLINAIGYSKIYYHCELLYTSQDTDSSIITRRMENEEFYDNYNNDDTAINILTLTTTSTTNEKAVLMWIGLGCLLITQGAEVLLSLVYLLHLYRQDPVITLSTTTDQQQYYQSQLQHHLQLESGAIASSPPVSHELVEEMWANRCSNACHCMSVSCCFLFGGRELAANHYASATATSGRAAAGGNTGAFGDVARALADYFESIGVLDVVPSDIVAGLIVLQQLQRQRIHKARKRVIKEQQQQALYESNSMILSSSAATNTTNIVAAMEGAPTTTITASMNNSNLQQQNDSSLVVPMGDDTATREKKNDASLSSTFVVTDSVLVSKTLKARTHSLGSTSNLLRSRSSSSGGGSPAAAVSPSSALRKAYFPDRTLSAGAAADGAALPLNRPFLISEAPKSIYRLMSDTSHNTNQHDGYRNETVRQTHNNNGGNNNSDDYEDEDGDHYRAERITRAVLSRSDPADMQALEEGARYAKFALSIYSWPLFVYGNPMTGVVRLLAHSMTWPHIPTSCGGGGGSAVSPNTTSYRRSVDAAAAGTDINNGVLRIPSFEDNYDPTTPLFPVEGDDMLHFSKSAIVLQTRLKETDIVYVQLRSGFNDNPYCIVLDHEWRSVVVSIRGTFSLEDCVTDVLIEPESLAELGDEFGFDGSKQFCHGGVLACVRNVYRDLQKHKYLDRLLLGPDAMYPDYTLRLVGHSLGAATCTILSYMLRPVFPSLRCVNYSPPGCTLTWDMAVGCQEWCISHVLDSEIVPRLSLTSMERLRDEILELIARIKVPKYEIAKHVVISNNNRGMDDDDGDDYVDSSYSFLRDILYKPDEVPESEYRRQLEAFKSITNERRSTRGLARSIEMYPPGRMLHLIKTGEEKSCISGVAKCVTCFTTNLGFQYTPVWIQNDDLNEIVVTATMGTDHFPNRMAEIYEQVGKQYLE